jgi:hypothetical protein
MALGIITQGVYCIHDQRTNYFATVDLRCIIYRYVWNGWIINLNCRQYHDVKKSNFIDPKRKDQASQKGFTVQRAC